MPYDPVIHHRHSIHLDNYDYSLEDVNFITLCTYRQECLLGDIVNGDIRLSALSKITTDAWQWLANQYVCAALDSRIILSDHLHGIIIIMDDCRGDSRIAPTTRIAPTAQTAPTIKRKPLGGLIGAFKTVSTKNINILRGTPGVSAWQRN